MAVELRCPGCRAKLRLPIAPEADSEIECPKCGDVFPADDNIVHAGSAEADDRPKKKSDDPGEDRPKKKKKSDAPAAKKDGDAPKQPKKRKLKKRKTNTVVLITAIVGGLMVLGCVVGALIWFFNRKSASMEMMTYLPDDCDEVSGVNIGHIQKYPEFYKSAENTFTNTGFRRAGEMLSNVLGQEFNETIEYVVQGTGRAGGTTEGGLVEATVFRTKTEIDTGRLSKLPGAKDYSQDGVKYYTIDDIPELGYPGLRVFAPTSRIVVFCRGDMPEKTFRAMLIGNKDDPDRTVYKRSGPLGKAVIRGTAWKFMLYGRSITKLAPPQPRQSQGAAGAGGGDNDEETIRREVADIVSSAQGCGYKASVGSREVRGEFVVWYKDSEAASEMKKKWSEKDWIVDEEKDMPKWFKTLAGKTGGGKTAPNVVRDGLAFKQTGELFIIRSAMDVKLLQQGVSTLVGAFGSQSQRSSGEGFPQPGRPGGGGGERPGRPRRRLLLARR